MAPAHFVVLRTRDSTIREPFLRRPPRWGGMVLATSKKTKDRELPLGAYPPIARGVGVVVEGVCLLVVLIGRLGRLGAALVRMLNEVPAAVER